MSEEDNKDQHPLYAILNEIVFAAKNGLDLIAISMAVALPDICSSLISEDGRTNKKKYKDWCTENLSNDFFSYITAEDMYSIRCGVLHQGRYGDLKHNISRIIFLPGNSGQIFIDCKISDAYIYSTQEFCSKICLAAYEWHKKNKNNINILNNSYRLMQYRIGGFEKYIKGLTVIA